MQDTDSDRKLDEDEQRLVLNVLDTILATDKFEAAPQMSAFLRYVVEQASAGNQNRIKAFTVAVDALGKPPTFDPQNDPVVRVLAGRLRATLSAYNEANPDAPVMITMTRGSYVPEFQMQNPSTANQAKSRTPSPPAPTPIRPRQITDTLSKHESTPDSPDKTSTSTVPPKTESAHSVASRDTPSTARQPMTIKSLLIHTVETIPKPAYLAMLVAVVAIAASMNASTGLDTSKLQVNNQATLISERHRPDLPSIFVSAIDNGNQLESSLKTLVSNVIADNKGVNAHRILDKQPELKFWPEDYVLKVSALEMPDQTRVDMQLLEAQTGRIIDAQVLQLDSQAKLQFSKDDIDALIDSTRSMLTRYGPLPPP